MEKQLVEYFLTQSPVVVVLAVVLWFYAKEKRTTEKRLVDLLRERKADRDEQLRMYGRVDAHLQRSDLFERADRQLLKEVNDPKIPKRRATDRALINAIAADDRTT